MNVALYRMYKTKISDLNQVIETGSIRYIKRVPKKSIHILRKENLTVLPVAW